MNPSGYTSLHGDYGQCNNQDGMLSPEPVKTPQTKCRIFVPPGTRFIHLVIDQYAGFHGIVRMFQPPQNTNLPVQFDDIRVADFVTVQKQDQIITGSKGKLSIFDTALPVAVSPGWLYVCMTGASGQSSSWQNEVSLYVDKSIYNPWQASVNWDRDVEGVTVYGTPVVQPTPQPVPSPQPVPNPTPPTQFSFTCPCGRVYTTTK